MWQKILDFFTKLFGQEPVPPAKPALDYSKMPKLASGSTGEAPKILQARLAELGFFMGEVLGNFYEITEEAVKAFQRARGLTPDGVVGPVTWKELEKDNDVSRTPETPPKAPVSGNNVGMKWIAGIIRYIGLDEFSKILNDLLVPEWANEGLAYFKTLAGNDHAWCSVLVNWAMRLVGIKPTNDAMAASWRTWGRKGDYWFGAVLGMRHASGGGHVTFFLFWIDKSKRIAACLGGNQGNQLNVTAYNLSGNASGHDEVVGGPRWPVGEPDGVELTEAEVRELIPNLKIIGAGSTR